MSLQSHKMAIMIRAMAVNAQVEAMKAENQARQHRGQIPAYTESKFFACSRELETLAREMIEFP
ncbi:MAG: hypothetical protein LC131_03185 [Anaerolineae bacterium]|jgi:hypothetical protein|nr:hypothetical protein [Rhodocyclaceae bacterium]MCZ2112825.1 hypothetical protein [Anaerolineae bacterium]GIK44731.1 MAG: hypothetical protein BroJett012_06340 [Betaproteobacteria bacterium]